MSFKNNASKFYFLTNKPIKFWEEETERKFEVIPPTMESLYTNEDLLFCIGLFEKDIKELKSIITIDINTHYEFVYMVCALGSKFDELALLKKKILNGFSMIIPNFIFDNIFKVNDIIINELLLGEIIDVVLLSMGKQVERILPEDDEFTRMEKEAKIRANKIRQSSKNKENGMSVEDLIVAILYEYPQYKISDLMSMNLYTIYYLFGYVGKIANYEVSKIAAGNGLAKKHQYFIEK